MKKTAKEIKEIVDNAIDNLKENADRVILKMARENPGYLDAVVRLYQLENDMNNEKIKLVVLCLARAISEKLELESFDD